MTDYESVTELAHHIDNEGTLYFWQHYTSPDAVTVAGSPLPDKIVAAAKTMAEAGEVLDAYFLPTM